MLDSYLFCSSAHIAKQNTKQFLPVLVMHSAATVCDVEGWTDLSNAITTRPSTNEGVLLGLQHSYTKIPSGPAELVYEYCSRVAVVNSANIAFFIFV